MIYTIPMLVTKNVDKHVIPGLCKAYEKFAIVYKMNEIKELVAVEINNRKTGKSLRDNWTRIKSGKHKFFHEVMAPGNPGAPGNPVVGQGTTHDTVESFGIDTRTLNDAMSIEPTWVTIPYSHKVNGETESYPVLLGVKVLPIALKDEEYAIEKLTSDRYAGWWSTLSKYLYRSTMRKTLDYVYKLWKIPFIGPSRKAGDPAKGSVKDDLFFNKSGYYLDRRIIVAADYNEFPQDFFDSPSKINKLFKLYWNAIFMVDNVNRRVFFAPPDYRGAASVIPYSYLFALSREQSQAFAGEDSARLKSSPMFSMKKIDVGNIFESIKHENKNRISEKKEILTEEDVEDSGIDLNKFTMKAIIQKHGLKKIAIGVKKFERALKSKDLKAMDQAMDFLPNVSVDSVELYMKKLIGPSFPIMHSYSQKVMSNSLPNVPKDYIRLVSIILMAISGKSVDILRDTLKRFVTIFRKLFGNRKQGADRNIAFDEILAYSLLTATVATCLTAIAPIWIVFRAVCSALTGSDGILAIGKQKVEDWLTYLKTGQTPIHTKPIIAGPETFATHNTGELDKAFNTPNHLPSPTIDDSPYKTMSAHEPTGTVGNRAGTDYAVNTQVQNAVLHPNAIPAPEEGILDRLTDIFGKQKDIIEHGWLFKGLVHLGIDPQKLLEFNLTTYFVMGMIVCFVLNMIARKALRMLFSYSQPATKQIGVY